MNSQPSAKGFSLIALLLLVAAWALLFGALQVGQWPSRTWKDNVGAIFAMIAPVLGAVAGFSGGFTYRPRVGMAIFGAILGAVVGILAAGALLARVGLGRWASASAVLLLLGVGAHYLAARRQGLAHLPTLDEEDAPFAAVGGPPK